MHGLVAGIAALILLATLIASLVPHYQDKLAL